MKAVMISIQPKGCELIASGKKLIDVRKTKPKIDVPFKGYIYCTKKKTRNVFIDVESKPFFVTLPTWFELDYGGKVIGEFICDKVEEINSCCVPYATENNLGYEKFIDNGVYKVDTHGLYVNSAVVFERHDSFIDTMLKNDDLNTMCLSAQKLFDYMGGFGKISFLYHISDLVIYNKPKELSEFKTPPCEKSENYCSNCGHRYRIGYEYPEYDCDKEDGMTITKPPQSWYYVQEKEND